MYFLMTNDVESFSISLNRCDPDTAEKVNKIGLPRLLGLLSKHDIQSTFYFTGMMAEMVPRALELVKEQGHEIGCHGYDHSPNMAFDLLSYEEQIDELRKAKKAIELIAGAITSFRAPALGINQFTAKALEDSGFTTDSSIAPQRLKLKNLGEKAVMLLDEILKSAKEYGFEFVSVREYGKLYKI